jgi:hypothetical protein
MKRKMIRYCESFRYCCKALSTHVSNDLTHVSVPAKYIKHAHKVSSTFVPTHAPSGSALVCPIMPIMDQYFCTHFKSNKLSATFKIFINNKRDICNTNSSIKATNNKIRSTLQKPQQTFVGTIP